MIYNIPITLADAYRGRKTVIRAADPSEIAKTFSGGVPDGLCYIRILSPDGDIDVLKDWGPGVPLDLVIRDPSEDLPLPYRFTPLLSTHPIRVSVPLAPGFEAIVKLASSLNFTVKLEGGQPDQSLTGELLGIARYYLHRTTVTEPIEFFHSLFLAFYHQDPVTLWSIQEEDPDLVRFVTDRGEETLSGRFPEIGSGREFAEFVKTRHDETAGDTGACAGCRFFRNCRGYFKWPARDYCCDGVKAVMGTLLEAAEELRRDVASFQPRSEDGPP
jgi:hypothetical protein